MKNLREELREFLATSPARCYICEARATLDEKEQKRKKIDTHIEYFSGCIGQKLEKLQEFIDKLDDWFHYNVDLDYPNKEDKRLKFLYKAIHSYNEKTECNKVHSAWKSDTDRILGLTERKRESDD